MKFITSLTDNMIDNPPIEYDKSEDSQSILFKILRILLTGNKEANFDQRLQQVRQTCSFLKKTKRFF